MTVRRLKIGTASAEPGAVGRGHLSVGELAMNSRLKIPVLIVNGVESGPVLWLNGAVHGDELNALMAIRNLAFSVNPNRLAGAIICTPLCNPLAVQWRNKINPYDYLDMDQQFPGEPNGTYSQRVAYTLFQEIKKNADYLISFHTVGKQFSAKPYTVYKYSSCMSETQKQKIEDLALTFGVRANCKVNLNSMDGEIPGGVSGGLDINCSLQGIPAFMAEIGSGGVFQEDAIRVGEVGIREVMGYLGMIEHRMALRPEQIIITKRKFIYSDYAGFLCERKKAGITIAKGDIIGTVADLFEDIDQIRALNESHVLMTRVDPVVHVGDRVAFVGEEWERARY